MHFFFNGVRMESYDGDLDGYHLWLYGVVLKRLDLKKQAVEVLCEALRCTPCHWGAWLELASLITDKSMVRKDFMCFFVSPQVIFPPCGLANAASLDRHGRCLPSGLDLVVGWPDIGFPFLQ